MLKRTCIVFSALILLVTAIQSPGASVTVNFDSGGSTLFNSNGSTPLTGGSPTVNGDGAVLQLGYFSSATSSQPFSGSWIALTGEGSLNTFYGNTTVGDDFNGGAGNGSFAMSLTFDTTLPGTNFSFPTTGTPLGIRIFNNTSIATSSHYMTISSTMSNWQWPTPALPPNNPSVNLSLDDASLNLQNGTLTGSTLSGGSNISTSIPISPVPEATTFLFGALAALAGALPRNRRNKVLF